MSLQFILNEAWIAILKRRNHYLNCCKLNFYRNKRYVVIKWTFCIIVFNKKFSKMEISLTWLSTPSKMSIRKKMTDQSWGKGIWDRAWGNTTNTNPGPSSITLSIGFPESIRFKTNMYQNNINNQTSYNINKLFNTCNKSDDYLITKLTLSKC